MKALILVTVFALFGSLAVAQSGAQESWEDLAAAARKEGKVVVLGPASAELRRSLPAAFEARFGVKMEYLGGRTGDQVAKIRSERQAGIYEYDAILSGGDSFATAIYPERLIDPLLP